jgi:phosphodiesterase/alkaline phosphatase D-like protein
VLTRILEADLLTDRMSRRAFLRAGGAGAAALTLGSAVPAATALANSKGLGGHPFAVGIASGEPARDGVVLWTRLALDALGQQPLPARPVPVRWEIAHDEALHRRVAGGWALARPDDGHSVHVEVDGLQPDREYNVQDAALRENPWIRFNANRRGYVRCTLTRKQYLAEFRTLPHVSTPGAPAQTKAAFVLEDGQPGLQPA